MHRHSLLLWTSLALVTLVWPSLTEAQMTATYLEYGARGAPGTSSNPYFVNWPVSLSECTANTPIEVQLQNAPLVVGTALTFALWRSSGGGTSPTQCQTGANRSGANPPCTRVETFAQPMLTAVNQLVSIPPQVFFDADCSRSGDLVFFLMAMSSPTDIASDVPASNFVTLRVVLDREPPGAPTVSSGAGDASTTVSWTNPSDTGTLYGARVYVDTSGTCGAGDGGAADSTLRPGGPAPSTATVTVTGGSPTSASVDLGALGLDYGESVPVAVSLVDLARNESVLSNVACLTRVQVEGFWSGYCRENGLSEAECQARYGGCSAAAGSGPRSRRGARRGARAVAARAGVGRRARRLLGGA
jgi:hypothetical protein